MKPSADDDDRRWFARNPGRRHRMRLANRSELAALRPAPPEGCVAVAVVRLVRRPGMGLVAHMLFGASHPPLDELSEGWCAAFFALATGAVPEVVCADDGSLDLGYVAGLAEKLEPPRGAHLRLVS